MSMSTPLKRLALAGLVAGLTVGPAFAQAPTPSTNPPPAAQPSPNTTADSQPDPADVLGKLHHSNQMEIEAGKLAQQKGQAKGVKDFGKTLVKDHTEADKKVASVAKKLNVALPTAEPGMTHGKLEEARSLTGVAFDKAFTDAMVEDHKTDVEEATEARDKTTNPQLKKLLTEMLPTLQKHRDQAEKLNTAATKEVGAMPTK